ncbi:MAG TPA: ChuX/HutX family heme-like substrate-binding protein [Burkholderiales bacterium]|nr:ChuX/HutX family heme-like substrate-binding protein [Burkholderiales bacterium]
MSLIDDWEHARRRGLNNRAAANALGVPEAQLVASGCGRFVTRLGGELPELLCGLPALGEVKSVVRNVYAVQERTGRATAIVLDTNGGLAIEGDVFLLRARLDALTKAFALIEPGKYGTKRSLQLFTGSGESAAKFFLTAESNLDAFEALVQAYAADNQGPEEGIAEGTVRAPEAQAAEPASLAAFLHEAARLAQPVEVVVANSAASQKTVKVLESIKRSDRGGWINVLDPGLDLHLHEDRITRVRVEGDTFRWLADDDTEAFTARCDTTEALLHAALGERN